MTLSKTLSTRTYTLTRDADSADLARVRFVSNGSGVGAVAELYDGTTWATARNVNIGGGDAASVITSANNWLASVAAADDLAQARKTAADTDFATELARDGATG